MKVRGILGRVMIFSAGLAGMLLFASTSFAQGCALCYNDAAATGPHAEAALRHGIAILLIPPIVIFSGLFSALYIRRNMHRESRDRLSLANHGSSSEAIFHPN